MRHRLQRVHRQVEERLTQHRRIGVHFNRSIGGGRVHGDTARLGLGADRLRHVAGQGGERHPLEPHVFGPRELQEALHDRVEALDLVADDVEVRAHVGGRLAALDLVAQQLEMDGHRVQRILDLVRDAGREAAERRHPLRELRQFLAGGAPGRQLIQR